ncbi:cation transporter [Rhodothalassium salexigens]|uniref:cation diffusion facilitator family transporter n=1 Tax=Rhodothalassium salexigens TaxID=1086 RepID=UPI0019120E17|nr:cation transporter [Rhodothalassium salexigens]MBK5919716.1 cation transporter [Rhodothalassium salexigens]
MAHAHAHGSDNAALNQRRLGLAALLTGLFMVAEVAGGVISGSLALLADAGHMATDFAALGLAWFAARLARQPADARRTYGFDRFSVLVAFANGLALFAIAGMIVIEAGRRLAEPVAVQGPVMLGVAAAGLAVNILAFWILHGADRGNLNVRAAALHVLGDLLGSVAAIGAAVVIMTTGWTPADPLLSILVALLILRSAWLVVRDAGRILLEAAPAGVDAEAIAADLVAELDGVVGVHHVHAWALTETRPMITLHACIDAGADPVGRIAAIKDRLYARHGIDHATVEIEYGRCGDEVVRPRPAVAAR